MAQGTACGGCGYDDYSRIVLGNQVLKKETEIGAKFSGNSLLSSSLSLCGGTIPVPVPAWWCHPHPCPRSHIVVLSLSMFPSLCGDAICIFALILMWCCPCPHPRCHPHVVVPSHLRPRSCVVVSFSSQSSHMVVPSLSSSSSLLSRCGDLLILTLWCHPHPHIVLSPSPFSSSRGGVDLVPILVPSSCGGYRSRPHSRPCMVVLSPSSVLCGGTVPVSILILAWWCCRCLPSHAVAPSPSLSFSHGGAVPVAILILMSSPLLSLVPVLSPRCPGPVLGPRVVPARVSLIAGNWRGLISLSRLEGPANRLLEGFLLSLFPLRSIEREREGQQRVVKLQICAAKQRTSLRSSPRDAI
jgi:hypothetical protein